MAGPKIVEKQQLKVALIHPDLGIGGAERLVLDVAIALHTHAKSIVFVTNHFDPTHAFHELHQVDHFPVCTIGDWLPRSLLGRFQALCAYIRMLYLALVYVLFLRQQHQPDLYVVDQIPMAIPVLKLFGCHVIYYCHHPDLLASPAGGALKKFYRLPIDWLELQGTAMADVILVNSEYTASVFRTTFPQIKKDIEILYPTVSASYQEMVARSKPKPLEELILEISPSPNNFVFLSINRFHPFKQLELAINAFELLRGMVSTEDWNRLYLIVAGGCDANSPVNARYFADLVALAQAKELGMKVIFLKSPSDQLKVDLLLSCDCLLYTPVKEHFGIVPLEAMVACRPVIACNSGGPRETVEDGKTGFLCENTAEDFAQSMHKMLHRDSARQMGLAGRLKLDAEFSHEIFVQQVNMIVDVFCRDPAQLEKVHKRKVNPRIVIESAEEKPEARGGGARKSESKVERTLEPVEERSENVTPEDDQNCTFVVGESSENEVSTEEDQVEDDTKSEETKEDVETRVEGMGRIVEVEEETTKSDGAETESEKLIKSEQRAL